MHAPAEFTSLVEAPLVAVVIPVYNAESTLAHTVESVTNQTHRNLEILLVDDGSTDASPEIAQRLAEQDARIRVIRQANQGVAATRNNGARAAKADYIAFLDNDDLWHPTKIEKQLAILIERGPDYGFVYAPCRIIGTDDSHIGTEPLYIADGPSLIQLVYVYFPRTASGLLFRRAAFESIGDVDMRRHDPTYPWTTDDCVLTLKVAQRWQFATCPEFLVGYRRVAGSLSNNPLRQLHSQIVMVRMLQQDFGDQVPPFAWRWMLAFSHTAAAMGLLRSPGRRMEGVRMMLSAIRMDPPAFVDYVIERFIVAGGKLRARMMKSAQARRRPFVEMPTLGDASPMAPLKAWRMKRLAQIDRARWDVLTTQRR